MAAPVRLEAEFFDDPDVAALATILGYEDRDTAAGKLARLYSWQTAKYTAERPTYAVPRSVLVGIFGLRGPDAMVECGLATLQADGLYKIHGSDKPNGRTPGKTRINWLWMECQAQAERARDAWEEGEDGKKVRKSRKQAGSKPEASRSDATDKPQTSSLISDLCSPDPDLSHHAREGQGDPGPVTDAMAGREQDVPGRQDSPPPARGQDSILALVAEAAAALNAERARLDASAPPIDDSTAGAVTQRLMATPVADRRRKLMHAVACVVARAKATRSIEPLRWSTFGTEAAWAYVVDASVAEYARSGQRPGHGARDSPARHQPAPPARRTPIRDL